MNHRIYILIALKSILLTHFFMPASLLCGEEDYQKYAMFKDSNSESANNSEEKSSNSGKS